MTRSWLSVLALGLALLVAAPASAQLREAALLRITTLNNAAMEAFDELEFEAAKKKLLEAIQVAKDTGITKNKALATTYMNLGIVFGAGDNDRENAVKNFIEALKVDGSTELDPMRATPLLEELFNNAKESVPNPKTPGSGGGLRHEPLDEAPAGAPIRLFAKVDEGIDELALTLHYRRIGEAQFYKTSMTRAQPGVYQGVIPADRVVLRKTIYYYIDATGSSGKSVANSGSATSPHIVSVTPGVGGTPTPPGGGDEQPGKPDKKSKTVSIALMVGTGFGFVHGGKTENSANSIEDNPACEADKAAGKVASCPGPGGALSPFHIAAEVSYHINERWHVGVLGRLQVVNALTADKGWSSKVSGLGVVRAKRWFGDGSLRFNIGAGIGGGQIRHRIKALEGWDARVAQYVAFDVNGGLKYMFTDYVGAVVDLTGLILVPDFAAHLDVNLGMVVSL